MYIYYYIQCLLYNDDGIIYLIDLLDSRGKKNVAYTCYVRKKSIWKAGKRKVAVEKWLSISLDFRNEKTLAGFVWNE